MQENNKEGGQEPNIYEALVELTRWNSVCLAIDILAGEREAKFAHEPAMALYVIKAWLSTQRPLSYVIRNAPKVFFSLILSEEVNKLRREQRSTHKRFAELFQIVANQPDIKSGLNAVFGSKNIIDFLINNRWRPHLISGSIHEENRREIEHVNELTMYRLRLGRFGYGYSSKDAASLLGKTREEFSWGSTTVKTIRSRWKEKESFLFAGRIDEFANLACFRDMKTPELLQSLADDAEDHKRNAGYFANVKGIISDLTPEISKELEKYERWRRIVIPSPIELPQFNAAERQKIELLGLGPAVRRSAEETKAAGRQKPRSK